MGPKVSSTVCSKLERRNLLLPKAVVLFCSGLANKIQQVYLLEFLTSVSQVPAFGIGGKGTGF
jgi:hypothetical protein